ncbi:sulfatase-like hydrolase/transferase [Haloarcula sp. H-GB4]|uniref:sulfatase-like hydrolase/transferase n=1 Tax=Haloarcula sp. H-GB4 TaxID=3069755 RepID=UPI0027B06375|nr:sulfatase-like hydrolase/transferase [Haloarcula sp. H-GB4]MDQ2072346.1 sulfatase-like hydrolase/transferase [Haloarcula sp. H-GB4]
MRTVAPEYEFIDEVEAVYSVGSTSKEWMVNTFTEEHRTQINRTTQISSNAWVDSVLTEDVDFGFWSPTRGSFLESHPIFANLMSRPTLTKDDFAEFKSLSHLNEEYGVVPAETVTDHAIDTGRKSSPEKMLVHYMQPHAPYLRNTTQNGQEITSTEKDPFGELRSQGNKAEIFELYLDNLRYVLDSVELLLNNLDRERVLITADHGELFGEFGISNHIAGVPHPNLKKVPLVETSATDNQTYVPDTSDEVIQDSSVEDRLADLGYL